MKIIKNSLKMRNPDTDRFETIVSFVGDSEAQIDDSAINSINTWSSKRISDNDIYTGELEPTTIFENKIWVDTSTTPATIKRYNGSSWESISSGAEGLNLTYVEIEDLTTII